MLSGQGGSQLGVLHVKEGESVEGARRARQEAKKSSPSGSNILKGSSKGRLVQGPYTLGEIGLYGLC